MAAVGFVNQQMLRAPELELLIHPTSSLQEDREIQHCCQMAKRETSIYLYRQL
jgi:hypothetical protein